MKSLEQRLQSIDAEADRLQVSPELTAGAIVGLILGALLFFPLGNWVGHRDAVLQQRVELQQAVERAHCDELLEYPVLRHIDSGEVICGSGSMRTLRKRP